MTAYYYQFTLNSNVIGYTQAFHRDKREDMEKRVKKGEALLEF